jgi:hypothetical protein
MTKPELGEERVQGIISNSDVKENEWSENDDKDNRPDESHDFS